MNLVSGATAGENLKDRRANFREVLECAGPAPLWIW